MNIEKLKIAEQLFFQQYPQGFDHPEMLKVAKKHKMPEMIESCQHHFARGNFANIELILEEWIKLVNRSSMVSMFDKPKFKTTIKQLTRLEKDLIVDALFQVCYGDQTAGFTCQVEILSHYKMANWSLISILPAYFRPNDEVFIKPTTTKGIIKTFELQEVVYHSKPTWQFYQQYRSTINDMKSHVDCSLSPNNAAFGGFLMMTMPQLSAMS